MTHAALRLTHDRSPQRTHQKPKLKLLKRSQADRMWDEKIKRYKAIGKELTEDDGAYVYYLHMKFNPQFYKYPPKDCKGYQVRIEVLGNGYSKWFGINQWGSKAEAHKAAALYREFAIAHLPNPFPTKEQFVNWMIRRAEAPATPQLRNATPSKAAPKRGVKWHEEAHWEDAPRRQAAHA